MISIQVPKTCPVVVRDFVLPVVVDNHNQTSQFVKATAIATTAIIVTNNKKNDQTNGMDDWWCFVFVCMALNSTWLHTD